MDLDGNGEISEEEFIKRCMEDEYLVSVSISVSSVKALRKRNLAQSCVSLLSGQASTQMFLFVLFISFIFYTQSPSPHSAHLFT